MNHHTKPTTPTTRRVLFIVLLWIFRIAVSYYVWTRTHSYLHQLFIYIVFWLVLGSFGIYELINWYRSKTDKNNTLSKMLLKVETTFGE